MQRNLIIFAVTLLCSSNIIQRMNAQDSSSGSCGCCPTPRCSSQPNICSTNVDCDCLLMTVTGGGLCANTLISCSNLTRCGNDNQTCAQPNTICVNNTRCGIPVCYPLAQATPQVCPPKINTIQNTTVMTSRATTSTRLVTTSTTVELTTTTTVRNACTINASLCLNNGTCQPYGNGSFYCICPGSYYGSTCQLIGAPDVSIVDRIVNGSNVTYERTVENVLNRNNWTNTVAAVDVTGSMLPCAAALYKWITLAFERVNKVQYYVFFNDGDNKPQTEKPIGAAGGLYGVGNSDLNIVLNTMKTAMKNGNGGDGPENDIEAILYGIKRCPTCSNIIHIADNQVTPRDMILLGNVTKPVKVIVCQLNSAALNTNLMNIASSTNGSIHTLEQDIINLSGVAIGGTVVIGGRTYRKTATGYILA